MPARQSDFTPVIDLLREKGTGPVRAQRPVYVDLLPPCNSACQPGENVQAWPDLAQAGKYREAWETILRDNPFPAVHGRVCYHVRDALQPGSAQQRGQRSCRRTVSR